MLSEIVEGWTQTLLQRVGFHRRKREFTINHILCLLPQIIEFLVFFCVVFTSTRSNTEVFQIFGKFLAFGHNFVHLSLECFFRIHCNGRTNHPTILVIVYTNFVRIFTEKCVALSEFILVSGVCFENDNFSICSVWVDVCCSAKV